MSKTKAVPKERTAHKGEVGVGRVYGPYAVEISIVGVADLLMHRWEADPPAPGPKGSRSKKEDNVPSYVYRCEDGTIGIPGMNFKMCLCDAGRYLQDPRSPRKSARDLFRAGLVVEGMGSLGVRTWDYEDKRRAVVQRNGINRTRPGFLAGWRTAFVVQVTDGEMIDLSMLQNAVERAGRFVGLCDFRPDFGRFRVESFRVLD